MQKTFKTVAGKGINGNFAVLSEIQERDYRDRNRAVAPLKPADDAILLLPFLLMKFSALALQHIRQRCPHLG